MNELLEENEPYAAVDKIEYWKIRCKAAEDLIDMLSGLEFWNNKNNPLRKELFDKINTWEKSKTPD